MKLSPVVYACLAFLLHACGPGELIGPRSPHMGGPPQEKTDTTDQDPRPRESQEPQEPEEPQEPQKPQEPQEPQQPQEPQEPQEPEEPEEPQEPQEPNPPQPAKPPIAFTIGTQNLWTSLDDVGTRNDNMFKRLSGFIPQIVAFQETWSWVGFTSVYETFLDGKTGHASTFCEANNVPLIMSDGVAVASVFKIVNYRCFELPHSTSHIDERWINISEIDVKGELVFVINLHLAPKDYSERLDQLTFIANRVANDLTGKRVILVGDFNNGYDPVFFEVIESMGFVHADRGAQPISTFSSANPYTDINYDAKIDYIFYRESDFKLKDVGAWADTLPVSDHTGIWAELEFK